MSKHDLILTVIFFILWFESFCIFTLILDHIEIKLEERKLKKQIKADTRAILNNQFKNELKELRK